MILAIDTSTALTSVAVTDHGNVIVESAHLDARKHAEVLAPMLQEALAFVDRAAITAIAIGVGPGPYTGLRVGIATATAMSAAWEIPAYGLCSLDAIAEAQMAAGADGEFGVASDARRKEVYWAWYENGYRREGPRVSSPDDIDAGLRGGKWFGMPEDSGPQALPEASWVGRRVQRLLNEGALAMTADVILSAHGDDGAETANALRGSDLLPVRPLYLRRPDAQPPS